MMTKATHIRRYDIPTSGFNTGLIVKRTERMLSCNRYIPFRVDVSIDGTSDIHDAIRGVKGAFDNAIMTVSELRRMKKSYPWFDLGIITTISSANQNKVSEISDLVKMINPDGEWMVNITRSKTRNPGAGEVNIENYIEAQRLIEDRIHEGSYKGHGGSRIGPWLSAKNAARRKKIVRIIKGSVKSGGCSAGALIGVIYSDGTVAACEMLDDSLGNIRDWDYNLEKLWRSETASKARKEIQKKKCNCTHECFLSVSMLLNPADVSSIIRERLRLAGLSLK
jgi:radical SAM protein with 4Fe4S-binding SPASM domain